MSGKINAEAVLAKRANMLARTQPAPAPIQTNVFGKPKPQVQNNPFAVLPPSPTAKNPFAKESSSSSKSFNPFGQEKKQEPSPQISIQPSPQVNFQPAPPQLTFQPQAPPQPAPASQPFFTFNKAVAAQRRQLEAEIAMLESALQARRFAQASLGNPLEAQNGLWDPMDWEPTPVFYISFGR